MPDLMSHGPEESERMIGHRTRLAQEARARWHDGEDRAVESYLAKSQAMDRVGALQMMAPRGWLAVGLFGLALSFVSGGGATTAMAMSVGGVLLGYRGLQKLESSLSSLLGAAIAWNQIADIFNAAGRMQDCGSPDFAARPIDPDGFNALSDGGRRSSDGHCGAASGSGSCFTKCLSNERRSLSLAPLQ